MFFGKTLLNLKYVFWFAIQILPERFLILRRIQRVIIMVHVKCQLLSWFMWSASYCHDSCEVPVIVMVHVNCQLLSWFMWSASYFHGSCEVPVIVMVHVKCQLLSWFMWSASYCHGSCEVPVILVRFFSSYFRKIPQISNFMKIRLAGAELFHADRQTEGQTRRS